MRSIIDGKRYDTDTSEQVAEFHHGEDRSNFDYFAETLFRTTRGAWFLFGRGHARSPYGRMYEQNSWGWGSEIRPLTDGEAQGWLERHNKVEALEIHFGEAITEA